MSCVGFRIPVDAMPEVPEALLQYCPAEHASANGNRTTSREGRVIGYCTAGLPGGQRVLWFVNLGLGRWHALMHHRLCEARGVELVVVDRPGQGLTDPEDNDERTAAAAADAAAVLDDLGVPSARLLVSCAGTPYALAFLADHGQRVTGERVAVGPAWVSPADCSSTKTFMRFASSAPSMLVRGVVGLGQSLARMATAESMAKGFEKKMTPEERQALSADETEALGKAVGALLEEGFKERGDSGAVSQDAVVCLGAVPPDRFQVADREVGIFAGDADELIPVEAATWLAGQFPHGVLKIFEHTSHMGIQMVPERMAIVLDYLLGSSTE